MFATIRQFVGLLDNKNKYITFGGTIIYCDDNDVCSIYNNILNDTITASVSA